MGALVQVKGILRSVTNHRRRDTILAEAVENGRDMFEAVWASVNAHLGDEGVSGRLLPFNYRRHSTK